MKSITEIFVEYLDNYGSVDIAESEFKKNIHETPELKAAYRQWCSDEGSSEKNGFFDFAEEYLSNQNEVWDSLTDYDDE